jgi:4-hydroxybenzoate polyprenyltransferase
LFFHLHTLWLFTRSDLKTVVFPQTAFALSNALSGRILSTSVNWNLFDVSARVVCALVWIWMNLLIEVIANQRLGQSIVEDAINKPWRPLPSKRLNQDEARRLLIALIPCAFILSWLLDVTAPCTALMVLTWLYNDLGGANEHFLLRNILNAFGLLCFGTGATFIVGAQTRSTLTSGGLLWFCLMGAVTATTVHVQDLADMKGDSARGRKTLPLVWGHAVARHSAAGMIILWSLLCVAYWNLRPLISALPLLFGLLLAVLIVRFNNITTDKLAWKLWCLWVAVLFALPLCASPLPYEFSTTVY